MNDNDINNQDSFNEILEKEQKMNEEKEEEEEKEMDRLQKERGKSKLL
jgi:hypothetical protein